MLWSLRPSNALYWLFNIKLFASLSSLQLSFYALSVCKLNSTTHHSENFACWLQILAPLPIGFAVFLVHLATIPITGTGINPARSLGAAIIYNDDAAWDDHVSIKKHFFLSNRLTHHSYFRWQNDIYVWIFNSGSFGLDQWLELLLLLFTTK